MKSSATDLAVIGAGPAGMMAAVTAARRGAAVVVFDPNPRVGKKLRITGKGRCNLTNDCRPQELLEYVRTNARFFKSALYAFPPSAVMEFFEKEGVPLKTERGGRVFPVSDKAGDVADALARAAERSGVRFVREKVVRILTEAIRKGYYKEGIELTDEFYRNIIKAAPMHDLGKIAVDDAILRKPGRFTPEEYEKMKTHSAEGARIVHEILKDTDDEAFRVIAENMAHYHHERWDGSGYPDGLRGEEIPFEARIMAVADVYDALVSKRIYKDSYSFEKANNIIMEGMGSQFDPSLKRCYERSRPALERFYETE